MTSRRSLNLAHEHLIELPPLPLTDAQSLFVERARARRPGFALDGGNEADVAEVCRQLEGVPLALEIAASLVGVLSPRQMLARLDSRLRWLVARDPSRPRRQQALRAAIDWSHDLLSEEHRTLFARLSVFSGGFTVEAAEAVACEEGEGCPDIDVLGGLLELRDQSLLRMDTINDDSQSERLAMLEAVRQYAAEKLAGDAPGSPPSPELAHARERHASYFAAWAQEKARLLGTREEVLALDELEAEFDNLRAALAWGQSHDPEMCARLAGSFQSALQARGLWEEARRCLEAGWEAAKYLGEDGRALRASLRFQMTSLAHDRGDVSAAREGALSALQEFRDLDAAVGIATCLNLLGLLETEDGQRESALAHFEQALELWPASTQEGHAGRGKTLHNMARLADLGGDAARAQQLCQESLSWRRRAGDVRGEAKTLGNLGTQAEARGDLEGAESLYRESLSLRRTLREPFGIAIMLNNLGYLATLRHDWPRALVLLIHAERMLRGMGSPHADEPARAIAEWSQSVGSQALEMREQAEQAAWEPLL